jgi:hypothetical protein
MSFVQWLGNRHSMPLPDTTIDRSKWAKSPIADWNSEASSTLKQVTAKRHHRQHFRFNSTFFLSKLITLAGENQDSPPQSADLAGQGKFVLVCFFHS